MITVNQIEAAIVVLEERQRLLLEKQQALQEQWDASYPVSNPQWRADAHAVKARLRVIADLITELRKDLV